MKAGDIIFVRGDSIISRIIRLFDRGCYSHVAIAVSDTEILEAQYFTRSRIIKNPYDSYDTISLELSNVEKVRLRKIAESLTGRWYDYRQVIGYVLRKPWNNPNNMICSEIVATILYEFGYNNQVELEEFRMMKPNELYRYLEETLELEKKNMC